MEKTIWKYQLGKPGVHEIEMPVAARVVHVAAQFDVPTLWVEVVPSSRKMSRKFSVSGTGDPIHDEGVAQYRGTCHQSNGLVWHVFEHGQLP